MALLITDECISCGACPCIPAASPPVALRLCLSTESTRIGTASPPRSSRSTLGEEIRTDRLNDEDTGLQSAVPEVVVRSNGLPRGAQHIMDEYDLRHDCTQQPEETDEQGLHGRWPRPAHKTNDDQLTEHTQRERTQLVRCLCIHIDHEGLVADNPTDERNTRKQDPHAQRFQIDHESRRQCERCNPGRSPDVEPLQVPCHHSVAQRRKSPSLRLAHTGGGVASPDCRVRRAGWTARSMRKTHSGPAKPAAHA